MEPPAAVLEPLERTTSWAGPELGWLLSLLPGLISRGNLAGLVSLLLSVTMIVLLLCCCSGMWMATDFSLSFLSWAPGDGLASLVWGMT